MNKFHKSSPGRDGRWNRSLRHFRLDTATARINIDDPTVEIPPPTILQSYLCESLRLFSLLVSVSGQCIQRCIRYVLLLNYRRVWKFVVLLVFCRRYIHNNTYISVWYTYSNRAMIFVSIYAIRWFPGLLLNVESSKLGNLDRSYLNFSEKKIN